MGSAFTFLQVSQHHFWSKHPVVSPGDFLATCLTGDEENRAAYPLTLKRRVSAFHSQLG